jgi:hypothetical protein
VVAAQTWPAHRRFKKPLIEIVRANRKFNFMSPGGASIYCSPHPAALQIDPPPGFRDLPLGFCARGILSAPETDYAAKDGKSSIFKYSVTRQKRFKNFS